MQTNSTGAHAHDVPTDPAIAAETDRAKAAESDLDARLKVLEGGTPIPPQPPQNSVTVTTIADLREASADDAYDEVVIRDGRYAIKPAKALDPAKSLWYGGPRGGQDLTKRTKVVTIRPESPWGAIFDQGGVTGIALAFMEGARFFRWETPVFDRAPQSSDGVIKIGGDPTYVPANQIELFRPRVLKTCTGRCTGPNSSALDHGIYFGFAKGDGPHHIRIIEPDIDCSGGLASGIHVYHSSPSAPNAHHVEVIGGTIRRAQQAVMLWDRTIHDWTLDGLSTIDAMRWDLSYVNDATGEGATGTPYNILVKNCHGSGTHSPGYSGGLYAPSGQAGLIDGGGNGPILVLDADPDHVAPPHDEEPGG